MVNEKPDIERLVWPKDGNKFQWIDRLDKIFSALTKMGVAYAGYNAVKHPMGAIAGLVALKGATSPNDVASAAGAATLAGLGVLAFAPESEVKYPSIFGILTGEAFGPSLFQLLFP
jgi:hypothetical protein